jgi:hypothetical protein
MPYGGVNLWTLIILVLIVLQWFRVGCAPGTGVSPEGNLTNNGGLFIIALFFLIACSCFRGYPMATMPYTMPYRRCC